jgi:hypothetical protein
MPDPGPLQRFLDSTVIDYEKWHDGIGYDLDALRALEGTDRRQALDWLRRRLRDPEAGWRDAEATQAAGEKDLIDLARGHPNPDVRAVVATWEDRRRDILDLLRKGKEDSVTLRALSDVPCTADPEMRAALLWCALESPSVVAYHAAEKLLEIYAGVEDTWRERPFLLRFTDPATRREAYAELIRRLTADPE